MKFALLSGSFLIILALVGVLIQYPFTLLKDEYDWVEKALADEGVTVIRDSYGHSSYCFIGPKALPVSTARAQFPTFWIEPFASDSLVAKAGAWTLAIASKTKNIVALRTMETLPNRRVPDEITCGDVITLTPVPKMWAVATNDS